MAKTAWQIEQERRKKERDRNKLKIEWGSIKGNIKEKFQAEKERIKQPSQKPEGIFGTEEFKFNQEQLKKKKPLQQEGGVSSAFPLDKENPFKIPQQQTKVEEPKKLTSGDIAFQDIDARTDLTEEEKALEKAKYNISRFEAGGTSELSVEREQEVAHQQAQRQQEIQQALSMAQKGIITPEQFQQIAGSDPDWKEAMGAGAIGVIPGLLGGAAAGAAAGLMTPAAPLTSTAGAIIGGAVGAITGFINSVKSNIKGQQSGEFSADKTALTKGITALNALITDANMNPQNAASDIELFYKTLNMIDTAHARTWQDSQENLNRFTGNDGTPELARFEVFNNVLRQTYLNRFMAAVGNPDPNAISFSTEEMQMIQELGGDV